MILETLDQQLERLQRQRGLVFQMQLGGMLVFHGRDRVAKALVDSWAGSGNVTSIAASPRWCQPLNRQGHKPTPQPAA